MKMTAFADTRCLPYCLALFQGKKKPAGKSGLNPILCISWRIQVAYAVPPQNLPILNLYTGYAAYE
jgi:hypothetical protein